jgi:hypothetical protein
MFSFFPPSRKPTPSEYAVLVVFISVIFIILGFRAPAENHELAVALEYRGAWCLGVGLAILAGYWLYRRL